MNRQTLDQTLASFGKTCGLPDLALDDAGYCCLSFDDVTVNLEADAEGERLMLYAGLGQLPADAGAELLMDLLDDNFFGRGTAGGSLGVDRATGSVALVHSLAWAEINASRLETVMKNFVDIAASWILRLAEAGHGTADDAAISSAFPAPQPWATGVRV